VRFAHRFAGGPAPERREKTGRERYRATWRSWGKCVFACGIAAAVLLGWLPGLGVLIVVWFVTGPLFQSSGAKEPKRRAGATR
jgi:hypothetical protein